MSEYCYMIEYSLPSYKIHAVHKVKHMYNQPHWYRMSISMGGFRNFCLKRFLSKHIQTGGYYIDKTKYKDHQKTFHVKEIGEEYERDCANYIERMNEIGDDDNVRKESYRIMSHLDVPVIEHANLYDFYDMVGYVKGGKRFTKPDPTPL